MDDRADAEWDRTLALLAQARADRDRLQMRVLQLEDQVRLLRRIPMAVSANRLRARWARRRSASASPPAPPEPTGPVRPGRYLDVTNLTDPARTGIARVTIRLAAELGYGLVVQIDGLLVHDTRFIPEIHGRTPSEPEALLAGQPLIPGPGVTVLNTGIQLDASFDAWRHQMAALRAAGGRYVQIVHDLLPITLPDFFDLGMRKRFPQWLEFVAANADLVLTDSDATGDDLRAWLGAGLRPDLAIRTWPLGNDPLPTTAVTRPERPAPRVLVVGTIEPRKALPAVIDAVEELRGDGMPAEMILVGRPGWAGDSLTRRLDALTDDAWFTWLSDADDQALSDQYATCDLLVAASYGEGFGLPIAESMGADLPVVARDLPVFRELLGPAGHYFSRDADIPHAIRTAWQERSDPSRPSMSRARVAWRDAAAAVDAHVAGLTRGAG